MSSEWLAPPDFQAIARHTLRSRYRAAFSAATAHSSFPRKDTTSSADTGAASSPPPPAAAAAAAAARSPRGGATRPPPRAPDMPRPPPPPLLRPARYTPPRACATTAPKSARGGSSCAGAGMHSDCSRPARFVAGALDPALAARPRSCPPLRNGGEAERVWGRGYVNLGAVNE